MLEQMGRRIRQARKAQGMTQTALARRLGVSLTSISDWETGKTDPCARSLAALASALGKDVSWLVSEGTGEESPGGGGPAPRGEEISIEKIDSLMALLKEARRLAEGSARGAVVLGQDDPSAPLGLLRATVSRMPRFANADAPVAGVAAADTGEGRQWSADAAESGAAGRADAEEPRLICVRGSSAEEFVRDGQHVVIDAACTNVGVGDVCVVLTRDGSLRLKRKLPDDGGSRRYASINPAYPAFAVPARQVVAEFPVCAALTKARVRSPMETVDEGPPPGRQGEREIGT